MLQQEHELVVRGIWLEKPSGHVLGKPQPEGELWSRLQTPREKSKTYIFRDDTRYSLGEVYGGARVCQEAGKLPLGAR